MSLGLIFRLWGIIVGLGLGAAYFAAPAGSPENFSKEAENAFRLQSYREAISKAEAYLKAAPDGPLARSMDRLIGMSLIRLRQYPQGVERLEKLLKEAPTFESDVEVVEALALAGMQSDPQGYVKIGVRVDKAVGLWGEKKNTVRQIDLLFKWAEYLQNHLWSIRLPGPNPNHQANMLFGVAKTLDAYDRVLALGGSIDNQVRALQAKAQVLQNMQWQLQQLPKNQWPAEIRSKYDLSQPIPLAIEFEREIVKRFPDSTHAPQALVRIAALHVNKQDFLTALGVYQEILDRYPRSNEKRIASEAIAQIKAPQLSLGVEGACLPGENPKYRWQARNLAKIEFVAYSVNLFDVLRQTESLALVGKYDLKLAPRVGSWTIETGDDGKHQMLSRKPAEPPVIKPSRRGRPPVPSADDPTLDEAPLTESGAYIVVGTGKNPEGKSIEVHGLFIVSRLGMVLKSGRVKTAAFCVDAIDGKPLPETTLLVQQLDRTITIPVVNQTKNIYDYRELTVPDAGLVDVPALASEKDRGWNRNLLAIARHGKDYAISDSGYYWYWWGFQDGYRVYSYTDRPVYRPKQTVQFKHVIRGYREGDYQNVANKKVTVRINDSKGNTALEKEFVVTEGGSVSGSFALGEEPPLGMYSTSLTFADQANVELGPGASFRVEEYKKPEFEVTLKTEKPTYKIGDKIEVQVHGEYYFGGPVPNAAVEFTVQRRTSEPYFRWPSPYDWFYDGNGEDFRGAGIPMEGMGFKRGGFYPRPTRQDLVLRGTAKTDEFGNAKIEFPTHAMEATPLVDLEYVIDVSLVDQSRRQIRASKTIKVTHNAFAIHIRPGRGLYQPGDTVRATVKSENPNGGPVPFKGFATISFVEQREEFGDDGKLKKPEKLKQLSKQVFEVDADGESEWTIATHDAGYYKLTVSAPDPYGSTVVGSTYVWVAKGTGELAHYANRDLEVVLDQDSFTAGEKLKLLLNTKFENAFVLLTMEADDLYTTRVVPILKSSTTVEMPIERSYRPNVTLTASLFHDNKIHQEMRSIKVPPVESFLKVVLKAPKREFKPRESAEIEVIVTDYQGKPVATELSLGVVDASIFYIQSETRGDIRKFFYGRQRPLMVRTTSSYAYRGWFQGTMNDRNNDMRADAAGRVGGAFPASMEAGVPMSEAAAAPMRMMAKSAGKKEAKDEKMAEPEVRSDFPDTVFWAAHLKTGSDGKAKATVKFPDSLTTWRLTAIAASPETSVGEIHHEVQTKKNVIVRLEAPRFFVERDRVTLTAIAHNYLAQPKNVRVSLDVSPELTLLASPGNADSARQAHLEFEVEVPAGGEKKVDFSAVVLRAGNAKLLAKALTDVESDALEQTLPSLEYGAEKLLAQSGILLGKSEGEDVATTTLSIPKEIRAGSQKLTVQISPTIAGVMLESLPYLIEYPYGCTEQTMSRFLPAVLTSATLDKLGIKLSDLKKLPANDPALAKRLEQFRKNPVYDPVELKKMIAAGVKRIEDFQQQDGGWGWWKSDTSNPYLSAYVVAGLATARESGVVFAEGMLQQGVQFLVNKATQAEAIHRYPWQQAEDSSVRIYMLYAIGQADRDRLKQPEIAQRLKEVYAKRDDLNDYSRALLALTLNRAGLKEETEITLANIKDRARVDAETGSASWGDYEGYYYWYQSGTEATSYSLKALVAIEPSSPLVAQSVNWLVRHRRGTRWFNTKDTAIACYALADYLAMTGELNPDLTVDVEVAGRAVQSVHITKENLFSAGGELTLAASELGTGSKEIKIRRRGRGNCYWTAFATFFTQEEKITEAGNELFVRRSYERLIPKEVEKTRTVFDRKQRKQVEEKYKEVEYQREPIVDGTVLTSGDLIEVKLEVTAKNNFEYLLFEDPKPAGCEAVELKSGYTWGGGLGAHMELRDERVAFFATYLNQGTHEIRYRLRAEIPGEFHALPSRAECMYSPLVRGNADSRVLTIREAK